MDGQKVLGSLLERFEQSLQNPLDAITWEAVKKSVPKQVETHIAQGGALEDIMSKLLERQTRMQQNPVIMGLLGASEAFQGSPPGS